MEGGKVKVIFVNSVGGDEVAFVVVIKTFPI
jgi:hypothetical protein